MSRAAEGPPRGRGRARLRLGLGLAQVMGATMTLTFLPATGLTDLTLGATGVTLVLTVLSRLIFAGPGRKA